MEWILRHKFAIPDLIHYLDDFLNVSSGSSHLAHLQLSIVLQVCHYLGIPLAPEKIEGPTHSLKFLRIMLDCLAMEARLPDDKLTELRQLLTNHLDQPSVTKGELAMLLGKLSFAARVVIPGRTFTRRLWDLKAKYHSSKLKPHFRVQLSPDCREDLKWWHQLLEHWNGRSFFLHSSWTPASNLGLYTDASGSWGWGAFYEHEHRWIHGQWTGDQASQSIEYKEMYAVVAACATWGNRWSSMRILLHCDNEAVVACLRTGTSRAPHFMPLLRCLAMICARANFVVSATHIAGLKNVVTDALSRGRLQVFRQLVPSARPEPDPLLPLPWLD